MSVEVSVHVHMHITQVKIWTLVELCRLCLPLSSTKYLLSHISGIVDNFSYGLFANYTLLKAGQGSISWRKN